MWMKMMTFARLYSDSTRTEYHRKRLSEGAFNRRPFTPEERARKGRLIAKSKEGFVFTEEHRKKIRESLKGRKFTQEWRDKIAATKIGNKNPSWRGGITPIHQRIRGSAKYKQWRKEVLERDNYQCVICKSVEKLEVDHIKSFAQYPESRFDISNGQTLCKFHHKQTANYGYKLEYQTH
jgi:5-methylcytosine-specific restriction enzyme A